MGSFPASHAHTGLARKAAQRCWGNTWGVPRKWTLYKKRTRENDWLRWDCAALPCLHRFGSQECMHGFCWRSCVGCVCTQAHERVVTKQGFSAVCEQRSDQM